jgi:K+/H+ antiporter YhaU regulatory subunit KhtT
MKISEETQKLVNRLRSEGEEIKVEKITIALDNQELNDYRQRFVAADSELFKYEEQKKEAIKEFKEMITPTKEKVKVLREICNKGEVTEERAVRYDPDFDNHVMNYIDIETGSVILTRKMYPAERQLKF